MAEKTIQINWNVLSTLILKDLKGRYKSSHLGFLWHILTPIVQIILYYIVFSTIMYQDDERYWLYLSVGVFPFIFLQTNLSSGAACIVNNGELIKKIYFPRKLIVLAHVLSSFIIFSFGYIIVFAMMLITGEPMVGYAICIVPVTILLLIFTTGYVMILSTLTTFIRDIQHFIDAFSRVFFWITPIFYYTTSLSPSLERLVWLNPFTYYIESYHYLLYYGTMPNSHMWMGCLVLAFASFGAGWLYFNRSKDKFAEVL